MSTAPQYAAPNRPLPARRRARGLLGPIMAGLLLVPVLFVLSSLFSGVGEAQQHVWTTTGPRYLAGTLLLCAIVGAGVSLVGAAAACLVALTDFPGRRFLAAALVLPFAVPAYIAAYAYADFLGPFGPVAALLGGAGAPATRFIPHIRSFAGAGFILTLSTYAYVYLAMRASLEARSGAFMEAARSLGARPVEALRFILLPVGRAALAGGLALALMETVAEFGVADYFGAPTLSVGIFRTWYGLGDLAAASQIAAGLFLIALLLTLMEQASRRGLAAESARARRQSSRIRLRGAAAAGAVAVCAAPPFFGFAIPVGVLLGKLGGAPAAFGSMAVGATINSFTLAGAVAMIGITLALGLAISARRDGRSIAVRIATLGYALPGAMLAIGVLAASTALREHAGVALGGAAALIFAMTIRFLTAGYNAAAGGLGQIHPLTDDAARMLGARPSDIAARIYLPLSSRALAAGALVIFIDVAKELPATLLLRPFNFETLATQVYRLASDERFAEAAPAALILIGLSLIPVIWLDIFSSARDRQTTD